MTKNEMKNCNLIISISSYNRRTTNESGGNIASFWIIHKKYYDTIEEQINLYRNK